MTNLKVQENPSTTTSDEAESETPFIQRQNKDRRLFLPWSNSSGPRMPRDSLLCQKYAGSRESLNSQRSNNHVLTNNQNLECTRNHQWSQMKCVSRQKNIRVDEEAPRNSSLSASKFVDVDPMSEQTEHMSGIEETTMKVDDFTPQIVRSRRNESDVNEFYSPSQPSGSCSVSSLPRDECALNSIVNGDENEVPTTNVATDLGKSSQRIGELQRHNASLQRLVDELNQRLRLERRTHQMRELKFKKYEALSSKTALIASAEKSSAETSNKSLHDSSTQTDFAGNLGFFSFSFRLNSEIKHSQEESDAVMKDANPGKRKQRRGTTTESVSSSSRVPVLRKRTSPVLTRPSDDSSNSLSDNSNADNLPQLPLKRIASSKNSENKLQVTLCRNSDVSEADRNSEDSKREFLRNPSQSRVLKRRLVVESTVDEELTVERQQRLKIEKAIAERAQINTASILPKPKFPATAKTQKTEPRLVRSTRQKKSSTVKDSNEMKTTEDCKENQQNAKCLPNLFSDQQERKAKPAAPQRRSNSSAPQIKTRLRSFQQKDK